MSVEKTDVRSSDRDGLEVVITVAILVRRCIGTGSGLRRELVDEELEGIDKSARRTQRATQLLVSVGSEIGLAVAVSERAAQGRPEVVRELD
jgi:hypothetical protein